MSQNFGHIKKVFDFHRFWVALASTESLFPYTMAIFNLNQCMVELLDFLKGLQAFFIQLGFVLFQFKHSDVNLCRREEVAPRFLRILNCSKLPLQNKQTSTRLLNRNIT